MGLFNIKWRRSFDPDVARRLDISDILKDKSYEHKSGDNLIIHIGEVKPFSMHIENLAATKILAKTDNSICFQLMYKSGEDEVFVAKWASTKPEVSSRDHIAVLIARDTISVPRYRLKEIFRHYNKFISIGIRTYIHGQTLKSIYTSLNDVEKDAIFIQVQAMMWFLAKKVSKKFGHINDGEFSTRSPMAYIRTRVFFDKALGVLNSEDWVEQGSDQYVCDATFCHGNLRPEHIIVDGTNVVGIVGWSKADFIPEIYERLVYYFSSNPKDSHCWLRKMAEVTISPESGRPSVEFVINAVSYVYRNAWNTSDINRRQIINQLWKSVTTNYTQLNCLSLVTEVNCDNMSLSSLTSTNWSSFTCSTAKPDSIQHVHSTEETSRGFPEQLEDNDGEPHCSS